MKITRVDAFAIGIGDVGEPEYLVNDDFRYSIYGTRHQTVIARVETDAGVIGYGEGQSPISPETTKTIVETALRPILLGRDPLGLVRAVVPHVLGHAGAGSPDGVLSGRIGRSGYCIVGHKGEGNRPAGVQAAGGSVSGPRARVQRGERDDAR